MENSNDSNQNTVFSAGLILAALVAGVIMGFVAAMLIA